jgi:hypothetical protein
MLGLHGVTAAVSAGGALCGGRRRATEGLLHRTGQRAGYVGDDPAKADVSLQSATKGIHQQVMTRKAVLAASLQARETSELNLQRIGQRNFINSETPSRCFQSG